MGNWFADEMPNEVPFEDIEKNSGNFHSWDFVPLSMQEIGYEDVADKLKAYTAEKYEALDDAGKEAMVKEVLEVYRSVNLLPIQYYSDLGVMNEIEKCIAYKAGFDGDTVSCVDGETEFFTGTGWKKIRDYTKGDKVLQYNEDGTAELVNPIEYVHYENNSPFYKYNSCELCSCQTGNHDVVYLEEGVVKKVKQSNILTSQLSGIPVSCIYDGPIDLSDAEVKALVDSVESFREGVYPCIDSIKYAGAEFSDIVYSLSVKSKKEFLRYLNELKRFCDSDDGSVYYFNTRPNMLKVAFIASTSGYGVGVSDIEIIISNAKTAAYTESHYKGSIFEEISDEKKYCFVVPSHMLVLRREGIMYITGNCGAGVGTTLCNYLFPNLFDVPSKHDLDKKDAETLFKKFHNDAFLSRAIKFCFSYKNGCPTPTNVMGGLRLVGSAPTNFRPMNAKAVYERFCPEDGTIYDFCCCDSETEYFNGKEWVKISEYNGIDKVLQYNEDGSASLVMPNEYIAYENDDPFYLYDAYNFNSCLTGNHDVVDHIYDEDLCNYADKYRKVKMLDVANGNMSVDNVPLTFSYGGEEWESPEMLYLMLVLYKAVCDGSAFYRDGEFYLKYDEVSEIFCGNVNFKNLLIGICIDGGVIEFSGKNIENETFLVVSSPDFEKYFSKGSIKFNMSAWNATSEEAKDELMDILLGDYQCDEILEAVNSPDDLDAKQFFIHSLNYVSSVIADGKLHLYDTDGGHGKYDKEWITKVESRGKYCFVVPSHMLVLRRKGKIFITGNCGFGGRMLGALSSKKNFRYVGTDPCTETMYHLHELGEYIEMVTGRENSYELHCCGSEDFRGPSESIDFAFSSPPYFDLEVYSDEETQCFNKFPVLEDWLEGYVRATIKNIHHMLKRGAVYAVNIADFTVGGGQECAYVDEWIRISTEEGMPLYDTVYLGVTARAGSAQQAAGELKKENILIFKKPL